VKINGSPIDGDWDLQRVYEELYGATSKKVSKTLTFQNEEWNTEQKRALKDAIRAISGTTEGTSVKFASVKEGIAQTIDINKRQHQFVRARTNSTEAMGKVFGNFLQHLQPNHHNPS
jgi:hypothetical protein